VRPVRLLAWVLRVLMRFLLKAVGRRCALGGRSTGVGYLNSDAMLLDDSGNVILTSAGGDGLSANIYSYNGATGTENWWVGWGGGGGITCHVRIQWLAGPG
jgi:hypothetical protein